jgi:hypothetical protein
MLTLECSRSAVGMYGNATCNKQDTFEVSWQNWLA